jgi:hypothetical protein
VTFDHRITLVLREITPRDFYFFSLVENDFPEASGAAFHLLMAVRLLDEEEDVLFHIPANMIACLIWWMGKNLIEEKLMRLDDWYNLAFHLQKQRWGDALDWLEIQPMSKILLMLDTQAKFNKEQEMEQKKNARRK